MLDERVLIVGAGPTGLMLAVQLARRGVRPLIIDRKPGPSVQSKALGVQARTLEIYDRFGVADRALALGARATAATTWARGRRAARVPLGEIGASVSPFPFLLILGQDDNERILLDALNARGIHVRWNTELVGLRQGPDAVTATIREHDAPAREIEAEYVAGCDGGRSAVRERLGIPFVGAPYEHVFYVADTTATGPMAPDGLNVYLWRTGFHLFFPMRGDRRWRVVGILPKELRGRDSLEFRDVIPSIQAEAGSALEFHSCAWFSTYRIHHRRAERFRLGRCFLLGDAAHVHSPVGAQGMNTGLQDAYNLAWKLGLVLGAGPRADADLLETYELERVPFADRLVRTTDRLFSIAISGRWPIPFFRTRVGPRLLAAGMRRERVRRLAFRTISQIGIRYRESPLSRQPSGWPKKAPHAGDRFPWMRPTLPDGSMTDLFSRFDDTAFNLIVVGQPTPEPGPWRHDLVRIHEISPDANRAELERLGVPVPSYFLLRPDGHVGLAGRRLEAGLFRDYVRGTVGIAGW